MEELSFLVNFPIFTYTSILMFAMHFSNDFRSQVSNILGSTSRLAKLGSLRHLLCIAKILF
jgi:hypothetical protein